MFKRKKRVPKKLQALVGSDVSELQAFKTNAGRADSFGGLWLEFTCALADYAKANDMTYIIISYPKGDLSFPYWDYVNYTNGDLEAIAKHIQSLNTKGEK